ncbi:YraN family protein [Marivita sp. S2033]|uniref:YraN family protein n=1 Tax=Marivita sp. S2033 TaxID=3373187 RepID=UPI003981E318
MPFDFQNDVKQPVRRGARQQTNYHAGVSAEKSVERFYETQGARLRETRWRGPGGEIDLIVSEGERIVFVEVKKSRTHAEAAQRITARQMGRIMRSAEAYLGLCPCGALTDARVDVALVDAQGAIEIVPNAGMMI